MTFSTQKSNPFNPFNPTLRDYQRTDILADKKVFIVLALGLLLSPLASALYLNRGLNGLKILGYSFLCSFILALSSGSSKPINPIEAVIGVSTGIVLVSEQSLSIKNARSRRAR